jgi:hypothetical protein
MRLQGEGYGLSISNLNDIHILAILFEHFAIAFKESLLNRTTSPQLMRFDWRKVRRTRSSDYPHIVQMLTKQLSI